jgi:hypothetical protein
MAITVQPTNANDQLMLGNQQVTSFVSNSFTTDTNGGVKFPLQEGVPMQTMYLFKVIPAAYLDDCIYAGNDNISGYVPLLTTGTAGTTVIVGYRGQPIITGFTPTPGFTGGVNVIQLDCERSIGITFNDFTTAETVVTIGGWDYRGIAVSEQLTIPIGETYFASVRPYSIIGYINFSALPGVGIKIGTNNTIGLPYMVTNLTDIINIVYDEEPLSLTDDVVVGNVWRSATNGVPNNIPEITGTLSARGVINLPAAPDGVAILSVYAFIYGADGETNTNIQNLIPSTLSIYSVSNNVSGEATWPSLVPQDLVGMQYPGDNAVFAAYTAALQQ